MEKISRRKFIYRMASLSLFYPLSTVIASSSEIKPGNNGRFPITVAVLATAYKAERLASEHYHNYSRKAVEEKYPNIAYLFSAFSLSEKIHAKNYKKILASLSSKLQEPEFEDSISDTKANLIKASEGEIKKIKETYPNFLAKLKKESHDQAVISCMYSWKSHKQHERKINEIRKYSPLFFGHVAKEIEEAKYDFYVCEICGSTIDEAPQTPCNICNHPDVHYHNVMKPA